MDFYDGKPVIITRGYNALSILIKNKWEKLLGLDESDRFDSIFVNGDNFGLASSFTRNFQVNKWEQNKVLMRGRLPFSPKAILWDSYQKRIIGYNSQSVYVIKKGKNGSLNTTLMNFYNLHGRKIGDMKVDSEYRTNIYSEIDALILSPTDGHAYLLDKLNNRVVRITGLFDNAQIYGKSGNLIYGGDLYPAIKPLGTNRILWYTSSVYWAAGGDSETTLNRGGPVVLRNLLNGKNLTNWEVMHAEAGALNYYSGFYSLVKKAINNYGFDYLFTIIDLSNFQTFISHGGLNIPAMFDQQGFPVEKFDAELASIPLLKRKYPPKIQNLLNHMKSKYGPNSLNSLINKDGEIHISGGVKSFYEIWNTDLIFQRALINIFSDLFIALNSICLENNIKFVIFLTPVLKEFFNEKKFNF